MTYPILEFVRRTISIDDEGFKERVKNRNGRLNNFPRANAARNGKNVNIDKNSSLLMKNTNMSNRSNLRGT